MALGGRWGQQWGAELRVRQGFRGERGDLHDGLDVRRRSVRIVRDRDAVVLSQQKVANKLAEQ